MMVWVANQCVNNGHDVFFLTYRDSKECQPLDHRIVHVHEQLEDIYGKDKKIIPSVRCLRRFIDNQEIDLAIAFLLPSQTRLALASVGSNCKTLFSQRGDPYQSSTNWKWKVIRYMNDILFCSADAFVFQTNMAANYYSKYVQEKSYVIANPIRPLVRTVDRVCNIEKNIVCVARLDIKQKRQDLLIDAFNIISFKYPEYKLKFYGDGFEYDEIKLKEKAQCNPNILFMGATNNVVTAIQNAAFFVLSSDYEGIPNALLEAMSLGVPCISTDCSPGGAAMLIKNKENGLLVPRGDAKALANAMEYVILHPDEAEQMGRNGMEVSNLYSEDVISKKWMDLIDKLK